MNLGIFAKTFRRETVSEIFVAVRGCSYSFTQFNMSCVGLASLPTKVGDETVDQILAAAASASEDRVIIEEACQLLGDQVVLAHAKDRDSNGKVCPAGEGAVDFLHFLRCLQEVGFRGPLIAHGIDESEAAPTAHYLRGNISKLGKGADHAPL
jgi:hypothetical protein